MVGAIMTATQCLLAAAWPPEKEAPNSKYRVAPIIGTFLWISRSAIRLIARYARIRRTSARADACAADGFDARRCLATPSWPKPHPGAPGRPEEIPIRPFEAHPLAFLEG